jgi:hypothetical protein
MLQEKHSVLEKELFKTLVDLLFLLAAFLALGSLINADFGFRGSGSALLILLLS